MTEDETEFDSDTRRSFVKKDTRRSFVKKGALAAGAATLGTAGIAAAQDDDLGDAGGDALILVDNFRPEGRFAFVSGVVEWTPRLPDVRDSIWEDYNTYQIRWLGSNEVVPLWVAQGADVGQYDEDLGFIPDLDDDADQPQAWQMDREWAPFSDNEILVDVDFSPLAEDDEDDLFDDDTWWGGNET